MNSFLYKKNKYDIQSYRYIRKYDKCISHKFRSKLCITDYNKKMFIIDSVEFNHITLENAVNKLGDIFNYNHKNLCSNALLSYNKSNYTYMIQTYHKKLSDYLPVIGSFLFRKKKLDIELLGIMRQFFIRLTKEDNIIVADYLQWSIFSLCLQENPNLSLIKYMNILSYILPIELVTHLKIECTQIACIRGKYSIAKYYSKVLYMAPKIELDVDLRHIKAMIDEYEVISIDRFYDNEYIINYFKEHYILLFKGILNEEGKYYLITRKLIKD